MPTILIADQPPEVDQADGWSAECALSLLANPILDPLFRPQPRSGLASAWHAHVPFAQWLVSAARPALIVELGTHNGISYAAFCETVLQEKLATRCYAVDSWAGDDHAGHYDESVFAELREFHDGRYSAFSELLRMTFDEARAVIADGTVDLLHIDGFHSYEAVRHDFEGWAPKLSPRAVVLFHDINVLERGFGVARFWAEVAGRFPSFSFLHGHGLGVLAVGPDVPPAIGRLCAPFAPSAVLRERFAVLGRVHGLDFALRETTRHEQRLRREAAERDTVVEDLRGSLDEVLRHRDSVLAAQAMAEKRLLTQESTITTQRQALREAEATLDDAREQAGVQEAAARHQAGLLEAAMREQSGLLEAAADNHAGLLEAAARDHAGLLKAAALDRAGLLQEREQQIDKRDQTISGFAARAAEDKGELSRLRTEIEGLWGSLAAARADTKGAREDGRAEAARLQAGIDQRDRELPALRTRQLEPSLSRPGFSLRPRRH
jgi:hypothetical protein